MRAISHAGNREANWDSDPLCLAGFAHAAAGTYNRATHEDETQPRDTMMNYKRIDHLALHVSDLSEPISTLQNGQKYAYWRGIRQLGCLRAIGEGVAHAAPQLNRLRRPEGNAFQGVHTKRPLRNVYNNSA